MSNSDPSILGRAVQAHTELRVFVEIALEGLGWAQNATRVHEIVAKQEAASSNTQWIEFHHRRAREAEAFAARQGPLGFPYLWNTASVQLWAILEVVVEDVLLDSLQDPNSIPADSILHRVEGALLPFIQYPAEQRAEHLLNLLKDQLRAGLKLGVGRFEALLQPVGLGGGYPEGVRRTLLELSQVRHLVVHKRGIVDRRFLDCCPWMGVSLSQPLHLHQAHFTTYGLAADWFIIELSARPTKRLTGEPMSADRELQSELEARLVGLLKTRPLGG